MVDQELLGDLIADCRDCMDRAEDQLVQIRSEGRISREGLNAVFREFHSVKGNAGFFQLQQVVKTAHAAENLLGLMREASEVRISDVNRIIPVCDLLQSMLDRVEQTGSDAEFGEMVDGMVAQLTERVRVLESSNTASGAQSGVASSVRERLEETIVEEDDGFGFFTDLPPAPGKEPLAEVAAQQLADEGSDSEAVAREQTDSQSPAAAEDAAAEVNQFAPDSSGNSRKESRDVRIATARIEELLNLVGELVIAESMVSRQAREPDPDPEKVRKAVDHVDRIVRDVQETALAMRMVPLTAVFRKVTRLVQDLARQSGKEVRLHTSGEETEIDKTLVESVADPLVHLVRNALDHGLEGPEERKAAGKSPTGTLQLIARHMGGEIQIILKDDGRGLDRERILAKAREQGLLSAEAQPSDEEVWDLIFQPGFSTAASVTELSGRGVGMDVVRKNLHKLRGSIDLRTEPGQGSSFAMRVPLTLAIIDGMVLRAAGRLWVLPTVEVERSIATKDAALFRVQDGREVARVQELLIPVIRLRDFFKQGPTGDLNEERSKLIVFIRQEKRSVGLYVDEILGNQQIVIKPLPHKLRNVRGLAGCTILGTGSVGLILDSHEILGKFSTGARTLAQPGEQP